MDAEHEEISNAPNVKRLLLNTLAIPLGIVLIMWISKLAELIFNVRFTGLGIFPLSAQGLVGILVSPFIHSDFSHLAGNSISIIVLGGLLFYFYKELALRVLIYGWVVTGFWVWVAARDAWHIGASGVVYSLAAFLFTSGLLRRNPQLIAITLLVVFLYGGLAWGVFPIQERISWESHLLGMASGVVLAIFFKNTGPVRRIYSWEIEEDEKDEVDEDFDPGIKNDSIEKEIKRMP
ncbi:MAG TPA: rhomboid family intramembrane serine protease [Bacteroidales bacterium]|nr:rhomboid family intramembrane serine protease [Bacteroidales bacterium]